MQPTQQYASTPTIILIALVCVIAGVLGALHVLPSEAVTAILGGAVAQAVALARGVKPGGAAPKDSDPPPPAVSGTALGAGTALGMLAGALTPSLLAM